MVIAGPMAALQAYLMELKWDASELNDWVREPMDLLPSLNLNVDFPWPYLNTAI